MIVNENDNDYMNAIDKHSDKLIDKMCILQEKVYSNNDAAETIEADKRIVEIDSQLTKGDIIPVENILRVLVKVSKDILIIAKEYIKPNCSQGCEVRLPNSLVHSVVNNSCIELISPEPADIPNV